MLDSTLIRRDSTPAEVLAAMLPVVREACKEPVKFGFVGHGEFEPYGYVQVGYVQVGGVMPTGAAWAWKFASHVLPALMELLQYQSRFGITCPPTCYPEVDRRIAAVDAALTAFRDAWCAAVEGAGNTKED